MDIAFRATPWDQERIEERSNRTQAQILFVSESNVCRSVLAEAIMNRLIRQKGMEAEVMCESKGTRWVLPCICADMQQLTVDSGRALAILHDPRPCRQPSAK